MRTNPGEFPIAYEIPESHTEIVTGQPHFSLNFKKRIPRKQIKK